MQSNDEISNTNYSSHNLLMWHIHLYCAPDSVLPISKEELDTEIKKCLPEFLLLDDRWGDTLFSATLMLGCKYPRQEARCAEVIQLLFDHVVSQLEMDPTILGRLLASPDHGNHTPMQKVLEMDAMKLRNPAKRNFVKIKSISQPILSHIHNSAQPTFEAYKAQEAQIGNRYFELLHKVYDEQKIDPQGVANLFTNRVISLIFQCTHASIREQALQLLFKVLNDKHLSSEAFERSLMESSLTGYKIFDQLIIDAPVEGTVDFIDQLNAFRERGFISDNTFSVSLIQHNKENHSSLIELVQTRNPDLIKPCVERIYSMLNTHEAFKPWVIQPLHTRAGRAWFQNAFTKLMDIARQDASGKDWIPTIEAMLNLLNAGCFSYREIIDVLNEMTYADILSTNYLPTDVYSQLINDRIQVYRTMYGDEEQAGSNAQNVASIFDHANVQPPVYQAPNVVMNHTLVALQGEANRFLGSNPHYASGSRQHFFQGNRVYGAMMTQPFMSPHAGSQYGNGRHHVSQGSRASHSMMVQSTTYVIDQHNNPREVPQFTFINNKR